MNGLKGREQQMLPGLSFFILLSVVFGRKAVGSLNSNILKSSATDTGELRSVAFF